MQITYQFERLHHIKEEILPILEVHAQEVDKPYLDKDIVPDVESYLALERIGYIACIVARLEGKMVGYMICGLLPNLHYKGTKTAETVLFYVDPSLRGKGIFRTMKDLMAKEAKRAGADTFLLAVKANRQSDKAFKRMGMLPYEVKYYEKL